MLRRVAQISLLRHQHHRQAATLLITESAATQLNKICDPNEYLRVSVGGGGCSGYSYEFDLQTEPLAECDLKFERDGATVGKFFSLLNIF